MSCVIMYNVLLSEPVLEQDYFDDQASNLMAEPEILALRNLFMNQDGDRRRQELHYFVLQSHGYC